MYIQQPAEKRARTTDTGVRLCHILGHQGVTARNDRKGRKCVVCSAYATKDATRDKYRPHYQCDCGAHVCHPTTNACFITHQLICISTEQWGRAKEYVQDGSYDPINEWLLPKDT